jgi:hypothetical protein
MRGSELERTPATNLFAHIRTHAARLEHPTSLDLTGPLVPHFGAHSLFYPHRCIRLEQVSPAAPYISSRPATGICLDLRTLPDTDVSALLEGFWPLGFIAAGLLAHAVLPVGGWRWVFLIEAIPSVFVFVVRFMVPESPAGSPSVAKWRLLKTSC